MTDVLAEWWLRLAATLTVVAERAGELAGRVAADWADDHGRERAERLAALQRALDAEAAAMQGVIDRRADDDRADDDQSDDDRSDEARAPLLHLPHLTVPGRATDRRLGVRLPGTEVDRVDDEPGVRLPGD